MEGEITSETSVYQSTSRHIRKDLNLHRYNYEELKFACLRTY